MLVILFAILLGVLHLDERQLKPEPHASPGVLHTITLVVRLHNHLDNRQTQTIAVGTGTGLVRAIKAVKQAFDLLLPDRFSRIFNPDPAASAVSVDYHPDLPTIRHILLRVFKQVCDHPFYLMVVRFHDKLVLDLPPHLIQLALARAVEQ